MPELPASELSANNELDPNIADEFHRIFPSAKLDKISGDDIPRNAMRAIDHHAFNYSIDRTMQHPETYTRFLVITHDSGEHTYIAQQTKPVYLHPGSDEFTYLVDIDSHGTLVGSGFIRKPIQTYTRQEHISRTEVKDVEYSQDKPFIGWTGTEEGFGRKGLGTRRLLMMNALSQAFYNLPLYSSLSHQITPSAKGVWEHLISQGYATSFQENGADRFVMKRTPKVTS